MTDFVYILSLPGCQTRTRRCNNGPGREHKIILNMYDWCINEALPRVLGTEERAHRYLKSLSENVTYSKTCVKRPLKNR